MIEGFSDMFGAALLELTGIGMIVYSLSQSANGFWNVRRGGFSLFSDLHLGPAIKLARELARDEHHRSGRSACVEMPGPASTIRLAHYTRAPRFEETGAAVAA